MNWRRVLSFCSVLVLMVGLALPVSAAGVVGEVILTYFAYDEGENFTLFYSDSSFSLDFDTSVTFDFYFGSSSDRVFVGSFDAQFVDNDGAFYFSLTPEIILGYVPGHGWVLAVLGQLLSDESFSIVFYESMKDGYGSVLTNVFNWVISWVGSIFEAVTVGPLAALGSILAVGISVSALFVALSYIFRIWRL